jgi:hypothetical protein
MRRCIICSHQNVGRFSFTRKRCESEVAEKTLQTMQRSKKRHKAINLRLVFLAPDSHAFQILFSLASWYFIQFELLSAHISRSAFQLVWNSIFKFLIAGSLQACVLSPRGWQDEDQRDSIARARMEWATAADDDDDDDAAARLAACIGELPRPTIEHSAVKRKRQLGAGGFAVVFEAVISPAPPGKGGPGGQGLTCACKVFSFVGGMGQRQTNFFKNWLHELKAAPSHHLPVGDFCSISCSHPFLNLFPSNTFSYYLALACAVSRSCFRASRSPSCYILYCRFCALR